ncbi:hypothetical protein H7X87_01735 [Acetobacteraceae bacterium]|nr:hypothetical protein [Candidatus Parcubacteria bacterium]
MLQGYVLVVSNDRTVRDHFEREYKRYPDVTVVIVDEWDHLKCLRTIDVHCIEMIKVYWRGRTKTASAAFLNDIETAEWNQYRSEQQKAA